MWGTIDLKYGILTKILVIFETIEIMSKKKGKIKNNFTNTKSRM